MPGRRSRFQGDVMRIAVCTLSRTYRRTLKSAVRIPTSRTLEGAMRITFDTHSELSERAKDTPGPGRRLMGGILPPPK